MMQGDWEEVRERRVSSQDCWRNLESVARPRQKLTKHCPERGN